MALFVHAHPGQCPPRSDAGRLPVRFPVCGIIRRDNVLTSTGPLPGLSGHGPVRQPVAPPEDARTAPRQSRPCLPEATTFPPWSPRCTAAAVSRARRRRLGLPGTVIA
ncbi:hypothetical protein STXM2123_5703 [Streptomyces sp. F-3]|jgi:hypothetical protein|nr:hypothetical protein STXM2123_5703 [Streptomyces sp. F-3]